VTAAQCSDLLSGLHAGADGDSSVNRFIGGSNPAVSNRNHGPSANLASEGDNPTTDSDNGFIRKTCNIHSTVSGQPSLVGRIETPKNDRLLDWPYPLGLCSTNHGQGHT